MPPTLIVVPRKPMRSKITKPDRSTPGKLLSIPNRLTSIASRLHRDAVNEHGIAIFGHGEISELAYSLWQGRGCPEGSPEEDWFHAAHQLRARSSSLPAVNRS